MQSACAVSCVASPALQYVCALCHKWHDFQKKVIEHKMRVLILSTTLVSDVSHSTKNSVRYYHKST